MNYINRLLSGVVVLKLNNQSIFVRPFELEDKLRADIISEEVYQDCFLDGVFTQSELSEYLVSMGWWSEKEEEELEQLQKRIEQAKLDYYLSFSIDKKRNHIKYNLDLFEAQLSTLTSKKFLFSDKTCEYVADYAKLGFLIERSSFIDNKIPVGDISNIGKLIQRYTDESLTEKDVRKVAKSHEWKSIWNSRKSTNGLFKVSSSELTHEQVALVSWAKFYESIYESMDVPSDDVIDDDIALDGWIIEQNRKRKQNQNKKEAEKLLPKDAKNAGELFIPYSSKEEKDKIISLNDGYGLSVLESTKRDVKEKGVVREMDLTHVRSEIQMEINKRANRS